MTTGVPPQVISAYQLLFAASTALFEMPPDWMEKVRRAALPVWAANKV